MATYMTTLMQKNASGNYDTVLVNGAYSTTATIGTVAWGAGKTATVNVDGVETNSLVFVAPAPSSYTAYTNAGIYCSTQGDGTLTFTCTTLPTNSITVNVVIM